LPELLMHRLPAVFVLSLVTLLGLAPAPAPAAEQGRVFSSAAHVLPLRERNAVENRILEDRLQNLLPRLMADSGLDMWLLIAREYADDPVYQSLVPQPSFTARRTTMLVFSLLEDGSVERLTVSRYPLGGPYTAAWEGGSLDEQWQALGELIVKKDPQRIGINVSEHWPVADGLTHGLHQRLAAVLPEQFQQRLVPAEQLVVRWLETRTEAEIDLYASAVGLARAVIAEAFSSQVITPGATTSDDVAWYIRQRFADLDLPVWFMPYVNIQRAGLECSADNPFCGTSGIIERGDVLHTDVGICYLKLCTDTQEMGYVAQLGESEVPQFLQQALAVGNRWQDQLTANFKTGRSGNEVLERTIADSKKARITSSTYTHPIGYFGHAPGPTIGMWDNQGPTPVSGDWPLYPNTAYAIEGNVKVPTGGWGGGHVHIKLEQGAVFDGEDVTYLAGRQTQWHLIQ
jgi:hypothetical protein